MDSMSSWDQACLPPRRATVGNGGLGCETAIHEEDERLHVTLAPHIGGGRSRWLHTDGIACKHNVACWLGSRPRHGKAIAAGGVQLRVWPCGARTRCPEAVPETAAHSPRTTGVQGHAATRYPRSASPVPSAAR